MRRMYSEQELTKIVKEVSEAYIDELIEGGEFDQAIADYVDAYLVEHPVDITALEGQTIAPAVVNASTSMSAPTITITGSTTSTKKIYCHPITIVKSGYHRLIMLIFNNSSTQFTAESLVTYIKEAAGRFFISGAIKLSDTYLSPAFVLKSGDNLYVIGIDSAGNNITSTSNQIDFETLLVGSTVEDNVNAIN